MRTRVILNLYYNLILFEAIFYSPFYFCMREMYNLTFVYLKNFVLLYFCIPDSGFWIPDSGFRIPAFRVAPQSKCSKKLLSNSVLYLSPEHWVLVLCVPPSPHHKTIQCYVFPFRIKPYKRKYLNKGKLSRHDDKLSLRRDNYFLSYMMWQQNLLFQVLFCTIAKRVSLISPESVLFRL